MTDKLTITLERLPDGRMMVHTDGREGGDWLGRDVRNPSALFDALVALDKATESTADDPCLVFLRANHDGG